MSEKIALSKARLLHAIGFVILGYFAFSVADLCSKKLQEHYSIYQVLSVTSTFGLTTTGLWLFLKYGKSSFLPANLKLHLLRALAMLGAAYFMVRSLQTLPLADFYGIVFVTPFFVMILAIVFLGEQVGWRRWGAAIVGFLGIIILASPQFNHIGEGVICALLGAFCAAINIVMLKKLGANSPLPLYGFYAFSAIALFNVSMLLATDSFRPFGADHAPYFLIHGPFIILAILATSIGFAKAPSAAVVAPFQYTQIVWGVLFGWVFYQVMPTMTTWVGLSLIIGAGLYSLRREYARAHHLD